MYHVRLPRGRGRAGAATEPGQGLTKTGLLEFLEFSYLLDGLRGRTHCFAGDVLFGNNCGEGLSGGPGYAG